MVAAFQALLLRVGVDHDVGDLCLDVRGGLGCPLAHPFGVAGYLGPVVEGGADHSYGIQVAALAGLPAPVLHRAREILQSLETQELSVDKARSSKPQTGAIPPSTTIAQMALFGVNEGASGQFGLSSSVTPAEEALLDKMKALEMERLSPIDAFQLLLELKQSLEDRNHVERDHEDHK